MTRFDAALVCALFLAGALWRFRTRPVAIAGMILAFGATVAPWIYYSEHHYGSLWASDNATVVAASSPVFVQDFHAPAGTLRTEPVRWAGRVAGNSVKLALAVGHAVLAQPLLLLALAAVFSLRQRAAWKTGGQIGWMTAAAAAGLAGCALTGYVDRRYFSFVTLLGACWVMGIALHSTRRFRLALAFAALLSPFFGLEWLREEYGGGMKSRRMPESIRLELERDHAHSVVLADSFCYEAGARTRVSTVCLPTDWTKLTGVQRQDFLTQLGITHAIRFEGAGYRIAAHPQPEWPIQDR